MKGLRASISLAHAIATFWINSGVCTGGRGECVLWWITHLPKFLLSSIFSGCLRTNQVILAVIHYSLNISCEWCSVYSSSSGSRLGSIRNQSCVPDAPCVCCVESRLQARTLVPPRRPKSSGFFVFVHCWLCRLGPLRLGLSSWHGYTRAQASAWCAQTLSQLQPHHWPGTHARFLIFLLLCLKPAKTPDTTWH